MAALYSELARYYDLLYSSRDYRKEVERTLSLLSPLLPEPPETGKPLKLLEVACGTGSHLEYLARNFECTGVDFNPGMLRHAKLKHTGARLRRGDMTALKLREQFDVLVCYLSSVGLVRTPQRLERTLSGFARHLRPGGAMFIEYWFPRYAWQNGASFMRTLDQGDLKIARVTQTSIRKTVSRQESHYLVVEKGRPIRHIVDIQEVGLFSPGTFLRALQRAGFRASRVENALGPGRTAFTGVLT
jgi:ubiquinone/menaquinone biosynthesis C-methylase UbiE